MTAFVSARNGTKQSIKKAARTAGFQRGGIALQERPPPALRSLIVAGKIHTFVHARDLLTVPIKHLGLDAIGIKQ